MAVKITRRGLYLGMSTDPKPTNAMLGDIFKETDTLKEFEWDGAVWNPNVKNVLILDSAGNEKFTVTNPGNMQLTGSYVCLSTEEKPAGQQNDTLLEHNVETGETKVYKFISGDWREL